MGAAGRQFAEQVPAGAAATFQRHYGLQQRTVQMLKQNGVRMLAGSDLGGIWTIPGFSLHQEFGELAAAGLSPLRILQMATSNGAEFLHREGSMGTVDVGKNANLVLLDANPLAYAANLSKIVAVVLRGKYLSRQALDDLKASVAAAYRDPPQSGSAAVLDKSHVE